MDPQKKQTILVVDDVAANIDILVVLLQDDYVVKAAIHGEKALQIARSETPPDLILLDIMMPDLDGYEVCRRLKADERTENIPIMFISALGEDENEEKGIRLGALDYIAKPFSPAVVKARVRNQLQLKYHQDHLEDMVRKRTEELELTQEATIESMAVLAEYRDPETGGHIRRTQNYVKALARCLSASPRYSLALNDEAISLLYKSAPLHDIGKVGIPDNILLKPGKLTSEEFEIMKEHAAYGHDVIRATEKKLGREMTFLHYAAEIALSHHEKWDGSGYPLGLSGEDIPLSGRLMALADVYDALISKRVYKPPFPHGKAVAIITEGRGSHFDPEVTDCFFELAEEFRRIAIEYADFDEERESLSNTAPGLSLPLTRPIEKIH